MQVILSLTLITLASSVSNEWASDPYDAARVAEIVAAAGAAPAAAPSSLLHPGAFANGMVLKADGARMFGIGANGTVTITVVDGSKKTVTTATAVPSGTTGAWSTTVSVAASLTNYTITVRATGLPQVLTDVLFGDVILCSGQSNMDFCLGGLGKCRGGAFLANETVAAAHLYPEIRLSQINGNALSYGPSYNGDTSDTIQRQLRDFSAVCYLTAVALKKTVGDPKRPMGLFKASVGGTIIEQWSPVASVSQQCGFKNATPHATSQCAKQPFETLYDSMVKPFEPSSITLAIWYQGESNVACNAGPTEIVPLSPSGAGYYACMLSKMVTAWRAAFGGDDFPFLVVELAAFGGETHDGRDGTVALRFAQQIAIAALKRAAMASTIDLGDDGKLPYTPSTSRHGGIHPRNKTEVGRRLALKYAALVAGVDVTKVATSGPTPTHVTTSGHGVSVSFAKGPTLTGIALTAAAQCHSHSRLDPSVDCCNQAATPAELRGMPFEVQLSNGTYVVVPVSKIDAAAGIVTLDVSVGDVVSVRYAYQGYPLCVLTNSAGLPAEMFEMKVRT